MKQIKNIVAKLVIWRSVSQTNVKCATKKGKKKSRLPCLLIISYRENYSKFK